MNMMEMPILDFITQNPWLIVLILLAVFGLIVLLVILIKRYSPHFKNTDKPKTDEEIAREEVERLTVPMGEENKSLEEVKEETRSLKKEEAPNEKEAADYETHRYTIEGDENLQRQMDQYAKDHPDEVAVSEKDLSSSDK